jgi:uncharacterized protein YdaU (DUF1376 family)
MVKKAYLPLYVRDFLSDPVVLGMTFTEQSVYLRMLMLSWEMGPLPGDVDRLARMVGLARGDQVQEGERCAIRAVLGLAWEEGTSGTWTNPRLERERVKTTEILEAQRERARKARSALATLSSNVRPDIRADVSPSASQQSQAQAQREEKRVSDSDSSHLSVESTEIGEVQEGGSAPGRSAATPSPRRASKKARKPEWSGSLPPALAADPVFPESWSRWISFRRDELRKPVTQLSGEQALREIEAWGPERGVRAIEHTIARGWQGLREPDQPRSLNGRHEKSTDQILREIGLR